jgi:pimeloyl-ACP methyl ester carboxylesterase
MILTRSDGSSTAYCQESGRNPPGIVFLPGFRSDMNGIKATALAGHCRTRDHPFLRFDYFGHGASSGDFRAGTIGRWLEDALAVIDRLTEGPLLLVGSSMGGWIALLAALARPGRVKALIGIAPAPDFTEDLIWDRLDAAQRRELVERGELAAPSAYEADFIPITLRLVEEGRRHLLLRDPIRLSCPVRLLHGMEDPDVPYQTSLRLMERLMGTEAVVELIEDGDHRLSRPQDLTRLFAAVDAMAARFRS